MSITIIFSSLQKRVSMWFIAWPIKDVKIQLFRSGGDSTYERGGDARRKF